MSYLARLVVAALATAALIVILALVAHDSSALESIMYDELTCEELAHGYAFNTAVLADMVKYHEGCVDFADSPASVGANDMLSCKFIREHGLFVQGIANDLAAVYNIKCAGP